MDGKLPTAPNQTGVHADGVLDDDRPLDESERTRGEMEKSLGVGGRLSEQMDEEYRKKKLLTVENTRRLIGNLLNSDSESLYDQSDCGRAEDGEDGRESLRAILENDTQSEGFTVYDLREVNENPEDPADGSGEKKGQKDLPFNKGGEGSEGASKKKSAKKKKLSSH